MDRLSCIQTFIEVARARSFTAAAQRLGVSKASVTKHIAALEGMLGAQLLTRNTQFVSLTDAGLAMLESGSRLIEDYDELENGIRHVIAEPRGVVRIGVPPSFGAFNFVPAVAAFVERHPDVQISLCHDDGSANLVRDGLDVSVRIAASLRSSSEISKLLVRVPQVLVAAPAYIARHGAPVAPADLERHNCLVHVLKSPTDVWRFDGPQGAVAVRIRGSLKANFGEALHSAALLGHGLSIHPIYMVHDDLAAGRLQVVMPDFEPAVMEIHAIYPQKRHMPVRVRAFLEFIKEWLSQDTRWLASPYHKAAELAANSQVL